MLRRPWTLFLLFSLVIGTTYLPAQEELTEEEQKKQAQWERDSTNLKEFRKEYASGSIRLLKKGVLDNNKVAIIDELMTAVARHNTLPAAKALFELATIKVAPPGGTKAAMAQLDFESELQVWKVRSLARKHVAKMDGDGIETWLLKIASARAKDNANVASPAGAALRILGGRKSSKVTAALLRASRGLSPGKRALAINALSRAATLENIPQFMDLLRDKEPNVRIAALNGLGRALSPHTDQTKNPSATKEVIELRDQVIKKLSGMYGRERIWQVRAAIRANLVVLLCKESIPALILCLKSELSRKKDPWALDIRLHRELEGLTGQTMPIGQYKLWQDFWNKEGRTFAWKKGGDRGKQKDEKGRYNKFFNLNLESDRVLFVLDFSGSMAEPAVLKKTGTASTPKGVKTTKAKLVVAELRKMIMALPDGTMFNLVVFSEDVRVWRAQNDGRPALVKIGDETRDDLLGSYLDSLHPRGKTNLYGALDKAFDFGGRGLHDKYYQAGFDTMYILSDGAPTYGKVTGTDEILRRVKETNALKRITIHTVTFGDKNEMRFLKKLAEQNGGRHIHVE